jgi:anhydro-N-acetylmuramic acid kinase
MRLIAGLMSGTSMDAVDAVLCRFDGDRWIELVATHSQSLPQALRRELLDVQLNPETPRPLRDWVRLDEAVARAFAGCANELIRSSGHDANSLEGLGSHGQTIFHDPHGIGSSWQIGNPSRIAALTGVTTVADFRRADVSRGGEGAPLVPAFHKAVFSHPTEARCVLNLGGIANLTVLAGDDDATVGFDIGPGNSLMDAWCERHRGQPFDRDGEWARSGNLRASLLQAWLADPYFGRPFPKSTGRDYFNLAWVRGRDAELDSAPAVDVQRTLCELTAHSVVDAIERAAPETRRVLVCGGGAFNAFLMERLSALAPHIPFETTTDYGLDPRWVEAAAFAWLAARTLRGLPGNLPAVTGAAAPAILGGIYRV